MKLTNKYYTEVSVFTPENLLREARRQKNIVICEVPDVCILDPDGDLVSYLIKTQEATLNECWACYHTKLYTVNHNGLQFAILGCAVGSSFAVLVAEQLFVSGCKVLISITSAGIINPPKETSKFVLITEAIRDEGTSYHYLPAATPSTIHSSILEQLTKYYSSTNLSIETGISWTTDAPYRETSTSISEAKDLNATCVEMEAAALYALAIAKDKKVICFAHLTNTMAQTEGDFEKGEEMGSLDSLELIAHTINALSSQDSKYWDNIYSNKESHEVSWTQDIPQTSLDFIRSFNLPKSAKIIDVGAGDSKLVDYLLEEGYGDITVLDISNQALNKVKKRLGDKASKVKWVVSDVTAFQPDSKFDLWHDRATFHFLTSKEQIEKYMTTARTSVTGFLTIGTFSVDGPTKCSGLEIKQYSEQSLTSELENGFKKIRCVTDDHATPFNTKQNFLFCSFKREVHGTQLVT